jgi:adenylate kinase
VTIRVWLENIQARQTIGDYKPSRDMLILDGIPRTTEQARLLAEHIEVLKIIHLTCSDEQAMFERLRQRALKENRYDDADEKVIRKRWQVYQQETAPVLECYDQSLVEDVDSIGSPIRILRDILDLIVPIHDEHFQAWEG